MARKRYKPEEIIAKLRQVEVLTSQGAPVGDANRQIGVSEVTYYRYAAKSFVSVSRESEKARKRPQSLALLSECR